MGLGIRGNWGVTKGPCNHSDQQVDSPNPPRSTDPGGAGSAEPREQLRHFTPLATPALIRWLRSGCLLGGQMGPLSHLKYHKCHESPQLA